MSERGRTSLRQATPPLLALGLNRYRFCELESAAGGGGCPLADEDLARRGGLLDTGRDVHRVAGDEGAALSRAADDDLSGVDADPKRERVPEELFQAPPEPEGCVERALSMVFLRSRGAEGGHDSVSDELLERTPGGLDFGRHPVVETLEKHAHPLRVLRVTEFRRSHEVGEEHGRDLALVARDRLLDERSPTGAAEAETLWVRLAATRADGHAGRVRRWRSPF